jgi:hypothetical protein
MVVPGHTGVVVPAGRGLRRGGVRPEPAGRRFYFEGGVSYNPASAPGDQTGEQFARRYSLFWELVLRDRGMACGIPPRSFLREFSAKPFSRSSLRILSAGPAVAPAICFRDQGSLSASSWNDHAAS